MTLDNRYKQAELGIIPEDWEIMTFDELGTFSKGSGVSRAESNTGNIPCIRYGELYTHHNDYIKAYNSYISKTVASKAKLLQYGDVLFAASGETKEEIAKSAAFVNSCEAYAGGDIIILSTNSKLCDAKYIGYASNAPYVTKQKATKGQGDAVVHITSEAIKTISVNIPSIAEQRAIAEALSDVDGLIAALDKKIAKKRLVKQGAMQQLLTGKKRLPGFTEEWVEKLLGELGTLAMCKRIFQEETRESGDVPFYKIGTFGQEADAFISKAKYEHFRDMYRFPNKGDVLISAAGTIGRTVVYNGEPAYFQDSNIVWLDVDKNVLCNEYLNHYYRVIKWASSEGSTIARLYNGIIYATNIVLPPLDEQKRIAEALSDVDSMISSLEKLIAKKKAVKQGAMQELLTGKKRLPGFTGEWYDTTIGEHCYVYDGTHQTPKYTVSGIPFYSVENVTANDFANTKFISEEEHQLLTAKHKIEKDAILMTRIGSIGDCKYVDWDVNASFYVSLALIKCKDTINAQFLSYYSNSTCFKKEIEIRSLLTAIPQKINLGPISEIRLNIPSDIKEQEVIASILSDMDNEIEALERKLAKTRQIKQGMMQQLLTGKIRLV